MFGNAGRLKMHASTNRYMFRDFTLEPSERRLSRHGVAVELAPKVFAALTLLVQRAGHLVSKDEFHAALWPRQIVSEATLSKCIWQLRQTLGGADEELIETVPRQGYRFTATVQVLPPEPEGHEPAPAAPAARLKTTNSPWLWATGAVLIFALGLGWIGWQRSGDQTELALGGAEMRANAPADKPAEPASISRHTIAIARTDVAAGLKPWLADALPELMGRELAVSEQVRVISRRAAAFESPQLITSARAASASDLTRWRALGAQFVLVSAANKVAGGGADDIELALRLVDTSSGQVFGEATARGNQSRLDLLVGYSGERVRSALGLNPASDSILRMRSTSLPRDSETARLYAEAVGFLSAELDATAIDRLRKVTAREPDFMPGWLELAYAELDQGYAELAAKSARAGLARAAAAPRELRLALEATQFEASGAWIQAVKAWTALNGFFPDQPDYALRLMQAQISANDKPAAEQTLRDLRALPGITDDAQVLRAEFLLARALNDHPRERDVAQRMLARAELMESEPLRARALTLRGAAEIGLQDLNAARVDLAAAHALYLAMQDRNGQAHSALMLGNVSLLGGKLSEAERHYHEAVQGYRAVGGRFNENVALDNLLAIAIARGDPNAARVPVEDLLKSTRALGDVRGEGRALIYLAWVELDAGDSAAAIDAYQQAAALHERANDRAAQAAALSYLADALAATGNEAAASTEAERALAISTEQADTRYRVVAYKALAGVASARGDRRAAREAFAQARVLTIEASDALGSARIDLGLAQLDLDEHSPEMALARLTAAEPAFTDATAELTVLNATRARALAALGRIAPAQAALAKSGALAEKTSGYLDHLPYRLAQVQVLAASGDKAGALKLASVLRRELTARTRVQELALLNAIVGGR